MLSSVSVASGLIYLPVNEEPECEEMFRLSESGVYLGRTARFSVPYFFSHSSLINPHIFVTGITGSGKSYLMKTLLYRLGTLTDARLLVLDLTGEYREVASEICSAEGAFYCKALERANVYINLSGIENEGLKSEAAAKTLDAFISGMRKRAYGKSDVFVFLDEAWKLVSYDSIELLIREGRKYGVGLILASQMLGDVEARLFENIATLFVFRLQESTALEKLMKNYNLTVGQISAVQGLQVGSCLVIQMHKSKERSAFFIRKIEGVEHTNMLALVAGDGMDIAIREKEFERMIGSLGLESRRGEIRGVIEEGRRIRLDVLVERLIGMGVGKREILKQLRIMRVPDKEIAEAFALAISSEGSSNG